MYGCYHFWIQNNVYNYNKKNRMSKLVKVNRLSTRSRHHFFGFHDLEISSRKSGQILVLGVDQINRPPRPDDLATICIIDPDDYSIVNEVTTTSTYNFPQGARQQWLGDTDNFIVNQCTNNKPVSGIYDGLSGKKVSQIDCSSYIVNNDATISYTIDYGRLHRLGGYGHVGIADKYPNDPAPKKSGIFATHLKTNQTELILSIAEVVEKNESTRKAKSHHFFTHLTLNPSGKRLAFLHRYRLPDGGEDSCLVTVNIDGSDCRILAQGFLSHFDWKDDKSIMIWGRKSGSVSSIRNNAMLQNSFFQVVMKSVKLVIRPLLANTSVMQCSFLLIADESDPKVEEIALGILQADGHPMVNPQNRDWLVVDNYPNKSGIRDLMLYRFSDEVRKDLGQFRMLEEKPSQEVIEFVTRHIQENITVPFSPAQYAFTRSGLHCDLHPRWFADGKQIAFDSTHEGSRQVYVIDVAFCLT